MVPTPFYAHLRAHPKPSSHSTSSATSGSEFALFFGNLDENRGTWAGFGVSLAWWANLFGSDELLADAVFSLNDQVDVLGAAVEQEPVEEGASSSSSSSPSEETSEATTMDTSSPSSPSEWPSQNSAALRTLPGLGLNVVRYNAGGCVGQARDGIRQSNYRGIPTDPGSCHGMRQEPGSVGMPMQAKQNNIRDYKRIQAFWRNDNTMNYRDPRSWTWDVDAWVGGGAPTSSGVGRKVTNSDGGPQPAEWSKRRRRTLMVDHNQVSSRVSSLPAVKPSSIIMSVSITHTQLHYHTQIQYHTLKTYRARVQMSAGKGGSGILCSAIPASRG